MYTETFVFELSPPPMFADLTGEARAVAIRELVKNGEAEFREQRFHLPALGLEAISESKTFLNNSPLLSKTARHLLR